MPHPLLNHRATGLGVQRVKTDDGKGYMRPARSGIIVHVGYEQDEGDGCNVAYLLCDDSRTWAVYLDGMEVLP